MSRATRSAARSASIAAVFPSVILHAERPILRTAPAPLFSLAQLVHDSGFKVVLTGEGADEWLAGAAGELTLGEMVDAKAFSR